MINCHSNYALHLCLLGEPDQQDLHQIEFKNSKNTKYPSKKKVSIFKKENVFFFIHLNNFVFSSILIMFGCKIEVVMSRALCMNKLELKSHKLE